MGRLKLWVFAISMTLTFAGCATTPTTTIHTGSADLEHVWVGTLDAVSNYLHVDRADRQKGLIEARSDGQWERNLAQIEIRENANQYDVTIGAYVEASKMLLRPSGVRAGEEEHLSDLNTGLRDTLVAEIKQRLGVRGKVKLQGQGTSQGTGGGGKSRAAAQPSGGPIEPAKKQ